MCLTIDELRGLCTPDNIYLTLHASKRLEQRGILIDDVIQPFIFELIQLLFSRFFCHKSTTFLSPLKHL